MKKLLFALVAISLFSCKEESKVEEAVAKIPIEFKVERFDRIFWTSKPEDLQKVKAQYPYFFPSHIPDSILINKLKDPLLKELYSEVQMQYPELGKIETDLEKLFAHVQYYFPKYKTPRVITLINEVDTDGRVFYTDTLALISLDCYLGKDHRFYVDFPEFKKPEMERNQILPNLVTSFCYGKIASPTDRTLLSAMIYYGKELYMKDKLIPEYSDADKIGYTDMQIKFCQENEYYMWSNLVENKLLFDSNPKNELRFIKPAPFSRFYIEIDNQTPGRVGQWLGWQIVRSYMENNDDVTLEQLLAMDAKTIFDNSKYKPKKQ
ncbi:MAG: gliding motility lipoprotein GldB [Flavobacterium sp.]|jgi:gliding motility-associated lipoprotein GldB|uniref:gliding motility lipoprotein GldB n=1 Tax=Flavobacterium sp. TaxID=239 RepID=UPI0025B98EB7|nr:gliding motility lipoprotein GldB [Flavobacterium sp.]MCK6607302.1 gliding motility lipoprotein GldB [Flavobacterium sp.]